MYTYIYRCIYTYVHVTHVVHVVAKTAMRATMAAYGVAMARRPLLRKRARPNDLGGKAFGSLSGSVREVVRKYFGKPSQFFKLSFQKRTIISKCTRCNFYIDLRSFKFVHKYVSL